MSDCTYTFKGADGKEQKITGLSAFKSFLANGGLEQLRGEAFSFLPTSSNVRGMADKDTVAGTQAPTSAGDGSKVGANVIAEQTTDWAKVGKVSVGDNGRVTVYHMKGFAPGRSEKDGVASSVMDAFRPALPEGQYWRFTNNKNELKHIKEGALLRSKNHADNSEEIGLSVAEGAHYGIQGYKYGYIVSGDVIGRGSDGEPLLDVEKLQPVSKLMPVADIVSKDRAERSELLKSRGWTNAQIADIANGTFKLEAKQNEPTTSAGSDVRFSRASAMLDKLSSENKIVGDSGREYSDKQREFFKGVGRDIDQKTVIGKALDYLRNDFWKKMAVGVVDQFRGLRDLADNGQAYLLARLSKGTAGALDAFLHHGKLSIKDGVYDADQTGGFIERLGVPLRGELDDFLWFVAANRAEKLSQQDRENLFTPEYIAAGKSLADGQTNFDYTIQSGPSKGKVTRNRAEVYADAHRVFNEFQKNALDIAEQSGLIDPESRKHWESEFYVPFYRVSEEDGEFIGAKMGKALVRQQAFKKLKGGTDKLNSDLLTNTLMNWSHLIEASAKNRAAKAALTAAEKTGAAHKAGPGEKKTVWFMDGGQKVEYGVDDPFVMTAITSLEYAGMNNGIMGAMSKFKHMLTIGVTASPAFKVRNLIRDSIQAIGTSDLSYNPIKNIKEGYKLTDRNSQTYVSALASGGLIRFGTMLEGSESARVRQLIKSGVKDSNILDSEDKMRAFYDRYIEPGLTAYNELGNRSEEINRAALYDQLIKQGKSHAEAALQARDLMDFSMQGSFNTIRFLTQVTPFLNARLQGLYKLGRAAEKDPAKMATVIGACALASIALMMAYRDDDDWKRREDFDRDNFWWFKFSGEEFRVPKPFEVGAVASIAERGLEYMLDDEMTGERFGKVMSAMAMNNLSMNPVPQMIKPIVDLYANKDSFTGRPIETMGMQRLEKTERYNGNTSMVARGLSNATAGALSPVEYDHLVRSYFGWLGSFVVGGADMVVRAGSDEPAKPTADYFKIATGGIVREAGTGGSRYVSQVYEQAAELERAYGTYHHLLKDGKVAEAQEYAEDNKDKLARYRQVESVKKAESTINQQIRAIERSNIDPDEKKTRIDALNKRKEDVTKRIAPGVTQ